MKIPNPPLFSNRNCCIVHFDFSNKKIILFHSLFNLFELFQTTGLNGSAVPSVGTTGSPTKPVPPPRDHLRIEKDGRLVNRAPAPQVNKIN